ncbi:putative metal-dependent peptidase [Patulibacter medicamentivorans]|uniref:Putative metal-dependent peptidase n=2 Tax=Patulibacter medicamentivorans TaxID=1097667 RepID=H0E3P5_9ACTN|nr:putative metal-dependent peptidase [Patulibacter medicamentivorans]
MDSPNRRVRRSQMNNLLLYALFAVPPLILGLAAQGWLRRTVQRFSVQPLSTGLTGAEVAERILVANGVRDVKIVPAEGALTDHYDPRTKTVALSEPVYGQRSITAAAVAAHEVGHALQHAQAYAPLAFRTAMFPAVAFASNLWIILLLAGFFLQAVGLVWLAIGLYAIAVLFHVVTLPVEFDASRRAGIQMQQLGLASGGEAAGTRKVLTAAASTYVVGALAAISQLVFLVLSTQNR